MANEKLSSNILLVSLIQNAGGNTSTAHRLRGYFETCIWMGANFHKTDSIVLSEFLERNHINLMVAIHALHCAELIEDISAFGIPVILVFGGTDVNDYSLIPHKLEVMSRAVSQSRCIVAFADYMMKVATSLWDDVEWKVSVIPQGVEVMPSCDFNIHEYLRQNYSSTFKSNVDTTLFTLVAGIRSVKDPAFLVKEFSAWHTNSNENTCMLIIGPVLDGEYAQHFLGCIESMPGIVFIPGLTCEHTHSAIKDSFVLVNSSRTEGMSAAVLEAMALETIVVARRNLGNASVIDDYQNGILYETPAEFIDKIEALIKSDSLQASIRKNAQTYVSLNHSCEKEKESYLKLIRKLTR